MVDAVVSYAVKKLGDFLIQQADFLQGIDGQVGWLQRELRLLRSYLKDAEQKQASDERIRIWVSEIQDIAYDTEDAIETFIFEVNKESIHSTSWGKMNSSMRNRFCCICSKAKLYDIGKDIEALKERVLEISRLRETYGINDTGIPQNNETSTSSGDLRLTTFNGSENVDVVGFEKDYQDLQAKLFDGTQSRRVISILGMGGLGKTTLAKKLYNSNKTNFALHARIYVSKAREPAKDLLRELLKSFNKQHTKKLDTMELLELETCYSNPLKQLKYLVVIDDLWDRNVWEIIKTALPDNKSKSRIIITSRREDVAPLSDGGVTDVHELRFLREEESWSLFCKKAFSNKNGECPNNFETLGKEMTAKCGGLPLAIVVLGGFLSGKEFHEWEEVNKHIWREVNRDAHAKSVMSRLLDLSYNDLSINIKLCFLYLGIFPEDASIDVEQLVKLWVAEGFIPIDEEGRTPEEVSECYFNELLRSNLIQTVEENWRMTSSCRVHSLLRYLALTKARETNFSRVCDEIGSSAALSSTSCRRFAVYSGEQREELLNRSHKKVRTLYFLNGQSSILYEANKMIDISVVGSFKLLRVLKIEGVDLRDAERKSIFFKVVGEMIHLGYFGLKNTFVSELPDSIRNLKALQTLYIEPLDLSVTLPKDM